MVAYTTSVCMLENAQFNNTSQVGGLTRFVYRLSLYTVRKINTFTLALLLVELVFIMRSSERHILSRSKQNHVAKPHQNMFWLHESGYVCETLDWVLWNVPQSQL